MAEIGEEKKKLIAEIKAQYPDMNKRIEELLANYSADELKTIKETMIQDNEKFQYRLNNQDIIVENTSDGSLKMAIVEENGETTQVYDDDNSSSMFVSDDNGDMVIQTDKNTKKTSVILADDETVAYMYENNIEVVEAENAVNIKYQGNRVKATFVSCGDADMEISVEGEIDRDGKFSGKFNGIDKEYKQELNEQKREDYQTDEEYELAKRGGEIEAYVENGEVIRAEIRDFIDYSPEPGSEHEEVIVEKNVKVVPRLEVSGGYVNKQFNVENERRANRFNERVDERNLNYSNTNSNSNTMKESCDKNNEEQTSQTNKSQKRNLEASYAMYAHLKEFSR